MSFAMLITMVLGFALTVSVAVSIGLAAVTGLVYDGAPMLLFAPEGDFTLVARLDAKLVNVYDVAALVLYVDEANWAKLCFEFSAEKEATVVSVITHGVSDDCNSEVIPAGDHVYYAICRKGAEYSFHWSRDGEKWRMVRHFRFESATPVRVGFAVHTPSSAGVRGRFSEIRYWKAAPGYMRWLDLSKLPQ